MSLVGSSGLFVKSPAGKTICVEYEPSSTIREVKDLVFAQLPDLKPEAMTLVFSGTRLAETSAKGRDNTLADYRILKDATLQQLEMPPAAAATSEVEVEVADAAAPPPGAAAPALGRPGIPQDVHGSPPRPAKARAQNKMRQFAEKEMRADGRKVSEHFLAVQRKKERSRCAIL